LLAAAHVVLQLALEVGVELGAAGEVAGDAPVELAAALDEFGVYALQGAEAWVVQVQD
jgi:hypothetical protein